MLASDNLARDVQARDVLAGDVLVGDGECYLFGFALNDVYEALSRREFTHNACSGGTSASE